MAVAMGRRLVGVLVVGMLLQRLCWRPSLDEVAVVVLVVVEGEAAMGVSELDFGGVNCGSFDAVVVVALPLLVVLGGAAAGAGVVVDGAGDWDSESSVDGDAGTVSVGAKMLAYKVCLFCLLLSTAGF